jgi:acylphosphatase
MKSPEKPKRLHAYVEGRVQGVGFRYFVLDIASGLNLSGWVRNTQDGSVEVLAEGERQSLEQLLVKLRQGPRSARVLDVRTTWEETTGEFKRFQVRQTV